MADGLFAREHCTDLQISSLDRTKGEAWMRSKPGYYKEQVLTATSVLLRRL